ncbi:MAG TPA: SpoIIE family protein phosphatase, partial [Vicinamibacterales bacterium]
MIGLPRSVADALQSVTYSQRALAYLQVDAELTLVGAGGNLENYGLGAVRLGAPAFDQAFFLEGLLPLAEAPYFMPSVELSGGRAADLHFYLDAGCVWVVLLDVTAERDQARRVQQKAYEMTLLQEKEALLNRRLEAANAELRATQRELEASREALVRAHERLQRELAEAAGYVRSLLPAPMSEPFAIDWRFVPSTELGGDAFGYNWVDADNFAIYLLDVCGHGVGPSLMSIAVLHVLQAGSLRDVDFRDPGQVLGALNERYQMKGHNDLYFTLWYGVYRPATRRLDYGCAGHPPAFLANAGTQGVQLLEAKGPPIGLRPGIAYASQTVIVPGNTRLYLFSDGAFEIRRSDGTMMGLEDLLQFMSRPGTNGQSDLDLLFQHLLQVRGDDALEDDFSIVRFAF